MDTYSAYGLRIRSAFDLPELQRVPEEGIDPDVVFRREPVEPVPESFENHGGRRIKATADSCRISYEPYGSFRIAHGKYVEMDPAANIIGSKILRRLLENEIMGVLLHQRGRLVLHASAVSVDGRAAIFLGPRGTGKSTTAAAFHEEGHLILEDDIVSIRFDDGTPMVDPGVPEMRLEPDAADALGIDDTSTYENDGGTDKRYHEFDQPPDPAPLGGCYVLDDGEDVLLGDLPGQGKLFNLVDHTYTQGLIPDTEQTGVHFEQCSQIADTVPFHRLARPKRYDVFPRLVDTVAADLARTDRAEA